jgi:hypothetical protein
LQLVSRALRHVLSCFGHQGNLACSILTNAGKEKRLAPWELLWGRGVCCQSTRPGCKPGRYVPDSRDTVLQLRLRRCRRRARPSRTSCVCISGGKVKGLRHSLGSCGEMKTRQISERTRQLQTSPWLPPLGSAGRVPSKQPSSQASESQWNASSMELVTQRKGLPSGRLGPRSEERSVDGNAALMPSARRKEGSVQDDDYLQTCCLSYLPLRCLHLLHPVIALALRNTPHPLLQHSSWRHKPALIAPVRDRQRLHRTPPSY